MKVRSPDSIVHVLMTDDGILIINLIGPIDYNYYLNADNTGWSAANIVFGEIKHLLCNWHVDRLVYCHIAIIMYGLFSFDIGHGKTGSNQLNKSIK